MPIKSTTQKTSSKNDKDFDILTYLILFFGVMIFISMLLFVFYHKVVYHDEIGIDIFSNYYFMLK